jgi:hypothetical protein
MTKSSKAVVVEVESATLPMPPGDDPLSWRPCFTCSRIGVTQERETVKPPAQSDDGKLAKNPSLDGKLAKSPSLRKTNSRSEEQTCKQPESEFDALKEAMEQQQSRGLKQINQVLKTLNEQLEKCLADMKWQGENFQEKNTQMQEATQRLVADFLSKIEQRWQQEDVEQKNRVAAKKGTLTDLARQISNGSKGVPDAPLIVTGQVVEAMDPIRCESKLEEKAKVEDFPLVPLAWNDEDDKQEKKDKKDTKEKKEKKEKKEETDKEGYEDEPDTPDTPSPDKAQRKRRKSVSSVASCESMEPDTIGKSAEGGERRRRKGSLTSLCSVDNIKKPFKIGKELKLERDDHDTSLYLVAEKADLEDLVTQELAKWNFSDKWKVLLADTNNFLYGFVNSKIFKGVANMVILFNVLFIAVQAEHSVAKAHEGEEPSAMFLLIDLVFCVFFFVEILFRLIGERIVFFLGPDWRWNVMDLSFVAMDVANQLFLIVLQGVDLGYVSSLRTGLKMVRLIRAARALRMFRIVRSSTRCRLLIEETVASMSLGLCLLALLFVVLTFFGIFFMQAAADVLLGEDFGETLQKQILKEFGTSPEAVFSLFQLTLGGMSWSDSFHNFLKVDTVYGIVFIIFVFFTFLLFLNVVTGVFVDSALRRSKRHEVENSSDEASQIRHLLTKADLGNAEGLVSKMDFLTFLNGPYGKEQLRTLGLGTSEALAIYELFDKDGNHRVNIDELASGCARFTQPVRSVDTVALLLSVRKMNKEQRQVANFVQNRFAAMQRLMELSLAGAN